MRRATSSLRAQRSNPEDGIAGLDCFVAYVTKKKQTDKLLILFNVMDEPPPSVLFHPRGSAKGRCGTRNDEKNCARGLGWEAACALRRRGLLLLSSGVSVRMSDAG